MAELAIKSRIILFFIYLVTRIIRPTIRVAAVNVNDKTVHFESS